LKILKIDMNAGSRTAVILIGYQNDYFSLDGKLHTVIQASSDIVLKNTQKLVAALKDTSVIFVETPIIFTKDYRELIEPSGILKVIKDVKAFKAGDPGSDTIPEIAAFGKRILRIPGKRGLNAFAGTCLEELLRREGVADVILCGAVTSVCIDSTGRVAHELGFRVHQLEDCSCGRTQAEQDQYCKQIFPLYANVTHTDKIIENILKLEQGKFYSPVSLDDLHIRKSITSVDVSGKGEFFHTAIILIGYQSDYFAKDGKLHSVIEASSDSVLKNTKKLLQTLKDTAVMFIETPIIFTKDYRELIEPSGILKIIKDVQAFKAGDSGSETIPELIEFGERILRVPGKRGLNAFAGTCLSELLRREGVSDVVLCGAVTSVCIDSTGRAAHELGFRVHQLEDCTCGRTQAEQDQYCRHIFPLYASVKTTEAALEAIMVSSSGKTVGSEAWRELQLRATAVMSGVREEEEEDDDEANLTDFMRLCTVKRISRFDDSLLHSIPRANLPHL
jgi:nicotinamidase-related amidase